MFDASGSAAALDSFQLIVALYLFYVAIKGSGTMYRFFDLPEEYQHKTRTPLRIIYAACGVSAVTTVLALVSSVAAYYCIYIVAVLLFALAVYYAIRQL